MTRAKLDTGHRGEKLAEEFLKKQGYKILERNWRGGQWGEIDLIALEGDTLVFVEVKTRGTKDFGSGVEAINFYKLRALERGAQHYAMTHPELPKALRIDVVAINLNPPQIKLLRNVTS